MAPSSTGTAGCSRRTTTMLRRNATKPSQPSTERGGDALVLRLRARCRWRPRCTVTVDSRDLAVEVGLLRQQLLEGVLALGELALERDHLADVLRLDQQRSHAVEAGAGRLDPGVEVGGAAVSRRRLEVCRLVRRPMPGSSSAMNAFGLGGRQPEHEVAAGERAGRRGPSSWHSARRRAFRQRDRPRSTDAATSSTSTPTVMRMMSLRSASSARCRSGPSVPSTCSAGASAVADPVSPSPPPGLVGPGDGGRR